MTPFDTLTARVVPLCRDDVDTDQIIPARFLKVTDKQGLGRHLFEDWRYDDSGAPRPEFVINRPEHQGAGVLLAGRNFGCGSSREHAPWALADWGVRAIIAVSFADIFRNNALKNGLLPIAAPAEACGQLRDAVASDAAVEVTIELDAQRVALPGGASFVFEVDAFAKRCLLAGTDQLGYLLSFEERIGAFERAREREEARRG